MAKYLIAVDAGHSINTPGKRTPPIPEMGGRVIRENEFNLPTAKKLIQVLNRCGLNALLVSDPNGIVDTPLATRTDRANKAKADLFVSIHYNAFKGVWGDHGGIDTFYYPSSTQGKKLAELVQQELIKATGLRDRGAKSANFFVLRRTKMPAILCECGFMDNLEEAKLMLDEDYQWKVAEAIGKGICNYLGVKYAPKPEPKPQQPKSNILYRVQTGAFKERKNAEALLDKIKKAGFDTYMVQAGGLYKVQVGAYSVKSNAEAMANKLKSKGFNVYITTESGSPVATESQKSTPASSKTTQPVSKKTWEYYISGSLVKELQQEINKQFNKKISVDGYFGDETINALPVVKQGARGNLTKIIQKRLIALGYNVGRTGVDGVFGNATYDAVKKFQRDKKLQVDGIVGKETWKALFRK